MRINLGPAGSPARSTIEGISRVRETGLQAMEVQFSHGIKMGKELAERCDDVRKEQGIELSIHAPYYINLNSDDAEKRKASRKRILKSCMLGNLMGAKHVVFHPAYYGKSSKEYVFDVVVKQITDMQKIIKKNNWNIKLAPETTGKYSSFGSLEEIVSVAKKTKSSLCIDFAHLYARGQGKINYAEILDRWEELKRKHLHAHFSNIRFTKKGEQNHLVLDHKPDFMPLAKEIIKRDIDATIISESPVTWHDSLKMKRIFEKLGYKFK